jgi:hypothetical protein
MKGYFTVANMRYKPLSTDAGYNQQQDSVASDIDIIGYHPRCSGPEKVIVVSCKSWQEGFWVKWELDYIKNNRMYAGRERWRTFRELANDKWALAFQRTVRELTGQQEFEYWIACLFLKDPENAHLWTRNPQFQHRLTPHLRFVTLHEMFRNIYSMLTTTPAGSEAGRLIQVMKAAKIKVEP